MYIAHSEYVRELVIPISEVFYTLFFIIGVPLILGMLCSTKLPSVTKKISGPIQKISVGIFMLMVIFAFAANFDYFCRYIKYILLIVLVHNGIAFATGYCAAWGAGLNMRDRRTITIETGIQNSGLALMLIFNPAIFPPEIKTGGMAYMAAWWGVWHIISGLTLSAAWNYGRRLKFVKLTKKRAEGNVDKIQ